MSLKPPDKMALLVWTGTALLHKEKLTRSQSHTASSAGSSRHRPGFNHRACSSG